MLSRRQQRILEAVVADYVATAIPVGSEAIARRHGLGVSPATIRNEMSELEEQGYIAQPHTSAGRIPLDKGYRYYVESLMEETELPQAEQCRIRHQFHQVERELEQWTRLASAVLSSIVRNAAIITLPKARQCRLKHLGLLSLHDFMALLVLVLKEAKLRQQMLVFDSVVSQEELSAIAAKFNAAFAELTRHEIGAISLEPSPLEEQVARAVMSVMQVEDEVGYDEPYLDGLRHMFGQPEFANSQRARAIIEVLEQRSVLREVLHEVLAGQGVKVIIGDENRQDALRECSLVVTSYGIPGEVGGVIGVVGPTRMHYALTISTVRYLASVMNELLSELYG